MNYLCIRTDTDEAKARVIQEIRSRDAGSTIDPEGNPVTFWVHTKLELEEIEKIDGVTDGIHANNACSCGSGLSKVPLSDARGIFCCYYCEACEEEKRSRYRVDVLEDPDYKCDEPINED